MCEANGIRFDGAVIDEVSLAKKVADATNRYVQTKLQTSYQVRLVAGLNNSWPALHVLQKSQSKILVGID